MIRSDIPLELGTGSRATASSRADFSTHRHFYMGYGLTIGSDLELPELEPTSPDVVDLSIRMATIEMPKPTGPTTFAFDRKQAYLAWEAVGAFRVSDASLIEIDPAPDVDPRLIAFPLMGPVMALVLHQRGQFVLHASAVAVGRRGAIFLGDKGAGKSTTAAAMRAAGHKLLTDDVLAIDLDAREAPLIVPGYPQLKLCENTAATIRVGDAEVLPQVHPALGKRQHRLFSGFSRQSVPPCRIYVLKRAESAAITPIPAPQALTELIRFSYMARFGRLALTGEAAAAHLVQCAKLADATTVCRLDVPAGLSRVGEAVGLIEDDLASNDSRAE